MRYLEDCVAKLKAESRTNTRLIDENLILAPLVTAESNSTPRQSAVSDEGEQDVEMVNSTAVSPVYSTHVPPSNRPSASPALTPQDSRNRQDSYSSVSTDQRHYSFTTSSTTSPALGPSAYDYSRQHPFVGSALTSPSLLPQRDVDQEATAALLMLNTDRRGTHGSTNGRGGMSVKDLLST